MNPDDRSSRLNPVLRLCPAHIAVAVGVLLFLGVLGMLALVVLLSGENVETSYPDAAAARDAGAIGGGKWLPSFLPASATDIRERHNSDTNETWVSFRFKAGDREHLSSACDEESAGEVSLPRKRPSRKILWWPSSLMESADDVERLSAAYVYLRCGPGTAMALSNETHEAYFWRR